MKLRHLVLFGFGKAHSSAAIAEVIRRFAELKALVPQHRRFRMGRELQPRGPRPWTQPRFLAHFRQRAGARRLPCASRSHSLFELGPAICVFGDGSGLLGRKDAQLSLRKRVTDGDYPPRCCNLIGSCCGGPPDPMVLECLQCPIRLASGLFTKVLLATLGGPAAHADNDAPRRDRGRWNSSRRPDRGLSAVLVR